MVLGLMSASEYWKLYSSLFGAVMIVVSFVTLLVFSVDVV